VTSFSTRSSTGTPVASFGRIVLSTGVVFAQSTPYSLSPTVCLAEDWVSTSGVGFWSRCDSALPEPGLCLLEASAISPVPSGSCFPRGFWPKPTPGGFGFLRPLAAGGVQEIFWESHLGTIHAYSATLVPGSPPAVSIPVHVASLQPGVLTGSIVDREPMGGLIPVTAGLPLEGRLLSFDGASAVEVPLTRTPCADDARCFTAPEWNALPHGYGTLARAVSLGPGEWLAIHQVRDDLNRPNRTVQAGPWDFLVVRRETSHPGPYVDPAPAAPASPLPGFPRAVEASALEAVCARLVACFPGAQFPTGGTLDVRACTTSWLSVGTGDPAADAAYQRFLATSSADCAAFHDTWPQVMGPRVNACGCQGDVAVICPGGVLGGGFDCRMRGLGCVLDTLGRATCAAPFTTAPSGSACNTCDAAGTATTCLDALVPPPPTPPYVMQSDCRALGLTCALGPGGRPICTPASPRCSSATTGSLCDGNVAYTCAGSPPVIGDRKDCARAGQACVLGAGCVSERGGLPGACPFSGEQCQGKYLAYCMGGSATATGSAPVRWLDCSASGFRTCAMKSDPVEPHATCVP
jgi:hypothetical protein